MTTPDLEPLDHDVLAVMSKAKAIHDLDAATKAKILHTVDARIGIPGGGGGGGGGSGTPASSSGLLARGARALAIFAFGVGAGIGVAPLVRPPPPPVVVTQRESAPEPAPSLPAEPALVLELPTTAPVAPPPKASAPLAPAVPSARGLAAERALLDIARSGLARGDATEALAAVDRHAREYPNGVLVEEREALAVKALVALGRRDEAHGRAARFEERFPSSLMLRAVKRAVGEP